MVFFGLPFDFAQDERWLPKRTGIRNAYLVARKTEEPDKIRAP